MTDTVDRPHSLDAEERARVRRLVDMYVTPAQDTRRPDLAPPPEMELPRPVTLTPRAVSAPSGTLDGQAPTLPSITLPPPAPPRAPTTPPTAFEPTPPSGPRSGGRSAFGRFLSALALLVVLGGLVAAGVVYGPSLVERFTGDTDEADEADEAGETTGRAATSETSVEDTRLEFPTATTALPVVRTAEFEVVHDEGISTQTYRITTDFQTGVARVVVERSGGRPALEILTLFDEAVVRRTGDTQWYRTTRGSFPFDGRLQVTDWVPTLDQLLPPERRPVAVIASASDAEVNGVPTRRLLVTDAGAELEVWVDEAGIVRKRTTSTAEGSETVTVLSTSSEPWLPEFPSESDVLPLSATTLVEL